MKIIPPPSKQNLHLEEWIRRHAYDLYEKRGRADGHELDHWLEAEREVLEEDQVVEIPA